MSGNETTGLRDTSEQTMIAAHQAGIAYWRNNRPTDATRDSLSSHARSCGWHGEDNDAWLAGYYGEQRRTRPEVQCLIDSHHGIYMWQMFANWRGRSTWTVSGVRDEDWAILEAGPDGPGQEPYDYTEAWFNVESHASITSNDGTRYFLHCDEDIFLVPVGMEWDDKGDCFRWPGDAALGNGYAIELAAGNTEWLVLRNGMQIGRGPHDRSGASGETFLTYEDALAFVVADMSASEGA